MQTIGYKLLVANSPGELNRMVDETLNSGGTWKIKGEHQINSTTDVDGNWTTYSQSVIKLAGRGDV